MYCSKCGTKVADDDYACYMCGSRLNNNVRSALEILREEEAREAEEAAKRAEELKCSWQQAEAFSVDNEVVISEDPIEATVREMFDKRASEFEAEDNEDLEYIHTLIGEREEAGRFAANNRVPVIAAVIIAAVGLMIAGVYLWLTKSAGETKEAVEATDTIQVSELNDKLPEEEKEEEIRVSMIERVRELRDMYLKEEVTYDEVISEFDVLKDNVFDDSAEFDEINEQINRINASRLTFEKAERAYGRGEYPDAVSEYREVLEEDEEYYKRAQEGIEKCNEAVLALVRGKWRYEYDARREVQQYVKEKGFDIDLSQMKIPIDFLFDLKADGSIEVSVDYDALNKYIDKVLDLAVETMGKGVEANIPGNPNLSALLKNMYNSTGLKDNIKEQLNIQEALDNLLKEAGVDKIDSYSAKDGHLYIGTACMDVSSDEETLTLTSQESEALAVGHYKMPYPIKMQLVEKPASGETEGDIDEDKKDEDVTIEIKPEEETGKNTGKKQEDTKGDKKGN